MDDDHLVELFEERAAIIEYDGKAERSEAEKIAYFDIKTLTKTRAMPQAVQVAVKRAMELLIENRNHATEKTEINEAL